MNNKTYSILQIASTASLVIAVILLLINYQDGMYALI
jgi:hypothetical protein